MHEYMAVWEGAVSEEPDCRRKPNADGGNEKDNGPTVGLGSCLRGKTCRNGGGDILTPRTALWDCTPY